MENYGFRKYLLNFAIFGFHEIIHNVKSIAQLAIEKQWNPMYSCFILVWNHEQCISTAPQLGRESGTNDFE